MSKIVMKTPLVEMDGDEMTASYGNMLDELIHPFVDLKRSTMIWGCLS